MRILLTGSSGFLGNIILSHLKNDLNEVFTISRTNANCNIDLSTSVPLMKEKQDLVIHAAGKAHTIPKTELEIKQFEEVNVNGTLNLLKGLETIGIPSMFVFISSVSVYGLDNGNDIDEKCVLKATNPYAKSKIDAEGIVSNWCKLNNVICTILRLPLIVGPNPPGNLGSMQNAIRMGFYFNISRGSARKSMVLASDVSKFILKAAEIGGTYNLTDGIHPNFNDLSHSIASQFGRKFVPNIPMFIARGLAFIGDIVGHKFPINTDKLNKITSTLTYNDSKARNAFGWNPTPVLNGFKINE